MRDHHSPTCVGQPRDLFDQMLRVRAEDQPLGGMLGYQAVVALTADQHLGGDYGRARLGPQPGQAVLADADDRHAGHGA